MIKFDYHMHTHFSIDSLTSVDDMVKRAIKVGLEEIAITDHIDFGWPKVKTMDHTAPIETYVEAILDAKKRFAPQIKILLGLEFGLRPDCADVIGCPIVEIRNVPYRRYYLGNGVSVGIIL